MKGLKEHVGNLIAPVYVLRKDLETIEEIEVKERCETGECVAVMFYNSVVYLGVPGCLGIKTEWCEDSDNSRVHHYALLPGFDEPISWSGYDDHPNYQAHDIGFNFGSEKKWGAINGAPIDWFRWTERISESEIIVYENGRKITPLEKVGCYKCANGMKIHMEETKKNAITVHDIGINYYENLIAKIREELKGYEAEKAFYEKKREDMRSLAPEKIWEQHPELRK